MKKLAAGILIFLMYLSMAFAYNTNEVPRSTNINDNCFTNVIK